MNDPTTTGKWTERSSAATSELSDTAAMFRLLFERSADAMTLQDPRTGQFLDANEAVVQMTGAPDKAALRAEQQTQREFKPDFSSYEPLLKLPLTPRVAEVLLWVAPGKTNGDIATILGISESTVKKHLLEIFQTLGVETRSAATLRALEVLSSPRASVAS